MTLIDSVRQWVTENIPYDRADSEIATYLDSRTAHDLLVIYHNWMSRFPRPQPREVRRSKAFAQNPIIAQRSGDLNRLIESVESGVDLRKYLSTRVNVAVEIPGKPSNQRSDLDLMLNDWGVHHLHISSDVQPDGFVTRDDPLLFVIFRPQVAYFIDVMTHRDWYCDHVLGVLVDEWPDQGVIYEIRGLLPPEGNLAESERRSLRVGHLNSFFVKNGKIYHPIGMISSAGTTMTATRDSDVLLQMIENFEADFFNDRKKYEDAFQVSKLVLPKYPSFHFAIRENGCGLIEEQTKAWIALRPDWYLA